MQKLFLPILAGMALAGAALTQEDTRRLEIDSTLTRDLATFARSASSQKAHTLARQVAQLVIDHYDADSKSARRVLGQRKVRGSWKRDGKPLPKDAIKAKRMQAVERKWTQLQLKAGQLHKDYAMALIAENAPTAKRTAELEMALRFLPNDAAVHRALGHKEIDGFWGTDADVAFATRMIEMVDKAVELRSLPVDTKEVPNSELPIELKNMGIPMFGARSKNYTYWSSESVDAAANLCTWSERCHAFLQHMLGPKKDAVRAEAYKWHVVLRTPGERDALLKKNPKARGPFTFAQAQLFVGLGFRSESGGRASATWQAPGLDPDHAIANVTKRHFLDLRNEGLGEGLTHVTTWLLCGSTWTYFTDLPKTSTGSVAMSRETESWVGRLWDEIDQGKDMPLVVVPRERPDNFRDSTRLKSWSFMYWILARYPDKWLPLIDACGAPRISPAGVEAAFKDVLGKPLGEIEQDWRAWARRGSKLGKATGWGEKR